MAKAAPVQLENSARNVIGEPALKAEAFEPLTIDSSPAAAASPAKAMQNALGREFAGLADVEATWSARRTVAFVICTCGAFWTAVYFGIAALVG